MNYLFASFCFLGLTLAPPVLSQNTTSQTTPNAAATPQSKSDWWSARHALLTKNLAETPCNLLFIGDSITHQWESSGKNVWNKAFSAYSPVNFGIGGDKTQHVLWRINDSGLKTPHSPQVCIIHIGTNNTGKNSNTADSPQDIAAGIRAIVSRVRELHPATEIIVLNIFPRGATKDDSARLHNELVNKELSKIDIPRVHLLDIGGKFLNEDGTFLPGVSNDLLHFTEKGYQIWADALLPEIQKYMK